MSHDTEKTLLLSYIGLLAERHAFRPTEGFEFKLWRDLANKTYRLVSQDEVKDLAVLVQATQCWVTGNLETGKFELIDLRSWYTLLDQP
jgi:hypothetical protein